MKIAKSKSLLSNAAWNIVSVAVSAIAGFILVPIIQIVNLQSKQNLPEKFVTNAAAS